MANDRARRNLPVIVSIIIALMLTMVPMPDAVSAFRPDWVALVMIFWAMSVPRSYSVGVAWFAGAPQRFRGETGRGDGAEMVGCLDECANEADFTVGNAVMPTILARDGARLTKPH